MSSFNESSHNFLPLFKYFEEFPDILVLTDETSFKVYDTEDIDRFHTHHTCRLGRRSGGCSSYVIYVKVCWNSEPIDDLCISNETFEISADMVALDNEIIYVLGFHRSHSDSIGGFSCVLADILSSDKLRNKNCTVLGDLKSEYKLFT